MRRKPAFIAIAVFFVGILFAGSAAGQAPMCLPGDPGVEAITIQFACPNVGASYETVVIKCPGDTHYRMDFVCQLCGRRHNYSIRYLPYPYVWSEFYFYDSHWYTSLWWRQHWPHNFYPPRGYRPGPPPLIRQPVRPPIGQPIRPPVGSPDRPLVSPPSQDPRKSRELQSPVPRAPRYAAPYSSPPPRPESIRVAPPAPTPSRSQSPRGSKSR